jgi:hypothetical protein
MNNLGLSPIFLVNRDPTETAAVISQFPDLDLRALETVEQVKVELEALEKKGTRLAAGTGAIPSIEPQTDAEKNVYEVAKAAFSYPYKTAGEPEDSFISLPSKPTFLGTLSLPPFPHFRADTPLSLSLCYPLRTLLLPGSLSFFAFPQSPFSPARRNGLQAPHDPHAHHRRGQGMEDDLRCRGRSRGLLRFVVFTSSAPVPFFPTTLTSSISSSVLSLGCEQSKRNSGLASRYRWRSGRQEGRC